MSAENVSIIKCDVNNSGEFTINCLVRNLHLTNSKEQEKNRPQKTDTKTCGGKKSETNKTPKKATQAPGLSELMSKTNGLATSFARPLVLDVAPCTSEKPAEPGSRVIRHVAEKPAEPGSQVTHTSEKPAKPGSQGIHCTAEKTAEPGSQVTPRKAEKPAEPGSQVTPHTAKPAEPGSQSLPSPVIAEIKDSILSSLPKLAEAFKKAGWDKRFSEDDVQKALENMVTNGEKSSEDFCKINGQVSQDGRLNLIISVNFFNVHNIRTEEVNIKGSLGVAINGSTLNINGVGLENWEDGLRSSCSQNDIDQPIITRL